MRQKRLKTNNGIINISKPQSVKPINTLKLKFDIVMNGPVKKTNKRNFNDNVFEIRKQSYLKGLHNRRKKQLKQLTNQNKRIYSRINSQKSIYSNKELNKSYQSNSSISKRISKSKITQRQRSKSTLKNSDVCNLSKPQTNRLDTKRQSSMNVQSFSIKNLKKSNIQQFQSLFMINKSENVNILNQKRNDRKNASSAIDKSQSNYEGFLYRIAEQLNQHLKIQKQKNIIQR